MKTRLHRSMPLALSIAAAILGACDSSPGANPPGAAGDTAPPANLSWLSKTALDAFLDWNSWRGTHSGYVALFARDGQIVHAKASGYADVEAQKPMQLETRFRIASMTKPVTAAAALLLIEEGRLGLDDPVARYIPAAENLRVALSRDFDANGRIPTEALARPLTVRDLLTFRAGIGSQDDTSDLGTLWSDRDIYEGSGTLGDRIDRILTAPLYEHPGERWRYGWTADVLARVVEVAGGEPFDAFLERRIFDPLGMSSTGFLPPETDRSDIAAMYTQDENQELVRIEAPASDSVDWTPGGSGLVSTAGDFMRFALMLWNRGQYDGVQILASETVDAMTRPHVASGVLAGEGIDGLGWGLGLAVVVDSDATPMIDETGDFWWSGYYGTTFFVSPETGLAGVVLSQNQPGPYSDTPYPVYLAQAFAFFGL